MNELLMIEIPQIVSVRKYPVDIAALQNLLRTHKHYSNNKISNLLGVPKTMVDHWFRTDKYFAIPDAFIWLRLKELLNITDDSFDKSIMEFDYIEGSYDMANRYYMSSGISPTITCKNDSKIVVEIW